MNRMTCFVIIVLLFLASTVRGVQYTVTDLGSGVATGINNSGQVVGYYGYFGGYPHGFRTAANQPLNPAIDDLGPIGNQGSMAEDINDWGQVVGSDKLSLNYLGHSFQTAANQPINPLTDSLGTLGGNECVATGINNSGQVVGCSSNSSGYGRAFRTVANRPINPITDDLGTLGGTFISAYGINDSGEVVGSAYTLSNAEHAFRTAANQPINSATDDLGPKTPNLILRS